MKRFWNGKICVLLALVLGSALRMARLGFQPLWWDEGYTVWFVGRPIPDMVRLTSLDIHPPLYYALLHLWTALVGMGPIELRLFSVAIGVLSIPAIYLLGREIWGKREGCLAAWILAIAPFHVYYSQEVRMYGLVTLFGMLAILFGYRFMAEEAGKWTLPAYVLAIDAALYTQYYAAFVWAGVAIYVYFAIPKSKKARWLAAQAISLALYLPWVLYAGSRLFHYVQGKVVADADRPLGLGMYLARHFATFAIGHLDGPFARLWPLGLIVWFSLLALLRTRDRGAGYLATVLGAAFAGGFLLNLKYPFAPVHGERLLLVAAPAAWLLFARSLTVLGDGEISDSTRGRGMWSIVFGAAFVLTAAIGLVAFYTVPRYPRDDYRPVIAQIDQQAAPGDTIYCVYPWQVGYWWSYGRRPDVHTAMPVRGQWGSEDQEQIEKLLSRGGIWFPEHETLGAILESSVERFLEKNAVPLRNSWFGNTRLTAWTLKATLKPAGAPPTCFEGGICLKHGYFGPAQARAENRPISIELDWMLKNRVAEDVAVGIHLIDGMGHVWSIRDSRPLNGDLKFSEIPPGEIYRDLHGIIVPVGTPPGQYTLLLRLHLAKSEKVLSVLDASGRPVKAEIELAKVEVLPQEVSIPAQALPIAHRIEVELDGIDFLGYTMPDKSIWVPGDDIPLSLFWRVRKAPGVDLTAFVQLLQGKKMVAGWEGPPAPSFPASRWQAGYLLHQQVKLHIPPTLKDGRYRLIVGLYRNTDRRRLRSHGLLGSRDYIGLRQIRLKGRKHRFEPYTPAISLNSCFDGLACLQGYTLRRDGNQVSLKLYWKVTGTANTRYTVFVHVLDPGGRLIAAFDGEPAGGKLPTTTWLPGEYIEDAHDFRLPPGAKKIAIGLYDQATGRRLPVVASGKVTGDKVIIPLP